MKKNSSNVRFFSVFLLTLHWNHFLFHLLKGHHAVGYKKWERAVDIYFSSCYCISDFLTFFLTLLSLRMRLEKWRTPQRIPVLTGYLDAIRFAIYYSSGVCSTDLSGSWLLWLDKADNSLDTYSALHVDSPFRLRIEKQATKEARYPYSLVHSIASQT